MLWEHEPQASVSIAFSSSPKLSRVFFFYSIETRNTCFLFLLEIKTPRREKEINLLTLIIKMQILFAHAITTSTARASSVSLSGYTNAIFNQSACVFS